MQEERQGLELTHPGGGTSQKVGLEELAELAKGPWRQREDPESPGRSGRMEPGRVGGREDLCAGAMPLRFISSMCLGFPVWQLAPANSKAPVLIPAANVGGHCMKRGFAILIHQLL